jgi:hypothetical protein
MALIEQLGEDQVSVPAPNLRTRTNVGIHSSTAPENLYVVKLDSLPTINCYSMLRGLWKLGDGKSLPYVLG